MWKQHALFQITEFKCDHDKWNFGISILVWNNFFRMEMGGTQYGLELIEPILFEHKYCKIDVI